MDSRFKKISVALMALGLSGAATAAGYAPAAPVSESSWHVDAQVIYMRAHSDPDVIRFAQSWVTTSGVSRIQNHIADSDWDWAYRIETGFHDGEGNDVTANWLHNENDDEITEVLMPVNGFLQPTVYTTYNDWDKVVGRPDYEFDRIGLELGHTFDPHNNFTFRVFTGVEYLRVEHDMFVSAYETDSGWTLSSEEHNEFEGFGIRSGADMMWNFAEDFNIFGNAAVAIVYGEIEHFDKLSSDHTVGITRKIGSDDLHTLVPDIATLAGVNWTHDVWSLALGWRHDVVVHAHKFHPDDSSNYSQGGPFLGITWQG